MQIRYVSAVLQLIQAPEPVSGYTLPFWLYNVEALIIKQLGFRYTSVHKGHVYRISVALQESFNYYIWHIKSYSV